MRKHPVVVAALLAVLIAGIGLSVVAVAGSGTSSGSAGLTAQPILDRGAVRVRLPVGYRVDGDKIIRPKHPGGGSARAGTSGPGSVGSSIPLADNEDPTAGFFTAFGKFRACLDGLGVEFIGPPDPTKPDAPQNDPKYLEHLGTCAARSNIVAALNAAQAAETDLSPEEIEERNKGYLIWRKCMIGRNWKIAKPTPDSEGRLFSIGSNSGQEIQAPPGKNIVSSDDVTDCAGEAQRKILAAR